MNTVLRRPGSHVLRLYRRTRQLLARSRRLLWGLTLGVLAALLLILLVHTSHLAVSSYELSDLQLRRAALQREYQQLRLELAERERLDRLREQARAGGLQPAQPEQLLYLQLDE